MMHSPQQLNHANSTTTAADASFDEFDLDLVNIDEGLLEDLVMDDFEDDIIPKKAVFPPPPVPHNTTNARARPEKMKKVKSGQLTIDGMFAQTFKFPKPSKNKPTSNSNNGTAEPIEIDSDYDDIVDDLVDDIEKPIIQQQNQQQQRPMGTEKKATKPLRPHKPFVTKELVFKSRGDNSLVEETHQMDLEAMKTYIYPLIDGQPARAYQQGAVQRCLFQNTLVALPTGMGKTLIAEVVMANYARWFPNCMAIFLAPTKPLVSQQIQACKGRLRAILEKSKSTTAADNTELEGDWIVEMNGSKAPKTRQNMWKKARFVFSTPQVLRNDLKSGTLDNENARRIALLVVDEAHRATGKYAYGESINALYSLYFNRDTPMYDRTGSPRPAPFRIMALTATPGSTVQAVKEIVQQLHTSYIFLRTEESIDVVPYMHGRQVEDLVIELPLWLLAARDRVAHVINRSINILCNTCHAMGNPGDPRHISGFRIRMERDRFLARTHGHNPGAMDISRVQGEFTVVMLLAHIMQLLSEHGLRPAWRAIQAWATEVNGAKEKKKGAVSTRAKMDCASSKEWAALLREFGLLINALDDKRQTVPLPSSRSTDTSNAVRQTDVVSNHFFNVSNRPPSTSRAVGGTDQNQSPVQLAPQGFLGHPKLERLRTIVHDHFKGLAGSHENTTTRIIVFSQYRGSVGEIVEVLSRLQPLVKCEPFIGQGKTVGSVNNNQGRSGRGRGNWGRGGWGKGRGRGGLGQNSNNNYRASSSENDSDGMADVDAQLLGNDDDPAVRGQTQKEQLAVLDRFRKGQTNVIAATCIGEEGLDIGEVDLIINYDAPSSPIRLLQRMGRTGRARRGKVIVLLAKDTREENAYKKAQREYKSIQARISTGNGLDLREDLTPPMLPSTLPPGAPSRTEMHLSRQEIAVADSMADGSLSKGKGRGKGKSTAGAKSKCSKRKSKGAVTAGIDDDNMVEYGRLSLKYQTTSSALAQSGDSKDITSQLLSKGILWQSSESPQCVIEHSERSSMYWRIMSGIEGVRFEKDLGSSGSTEGFRLPPRSSASSSSKKASERMTKLLLQTRKQRSPLAAKQSTTTTVSPAKKRSWQVLPDSKGEEVINDGDDAFLDSPTKKHRPIPTAAGAPQFPTNTNSKGGGGQHQRKTSFQESIVGSIARLAKSSKAKHAFEWSLDPDPALVDEAKNRGVDIGLIPFVDFCGKTALLDNVKLVSASSSLFGDLGKPGTFDKLYDNAASSEQVLCPESSLEESNARRVVATNSTTGTSTFASISGKSAVPETPLSGGSMDIVNVAANCLSLITTTTKEIHKLKNVDAAAPSYADEDIDADLCAFELSQEDIITASDEESKDQAGDHIALQAIDDLMLSSPIACGRKRKGGGGGDGEEVDPSTTPVLPPQSSSPPVRVPVRRRLQRHRTTSANTTVEERIEPLFKTPEKNRLQTPPRAQPRPRSRPRLKKRSANPFIDDEAGMGDSSDDDDGDEGGQQRRRRRKGAKGFIDGESSGDDEDEGLDGELSSFIVDDEHIDYATQFGARKNGDGSMLDQNEPVTPVRSGDLYRRSLMASPPSTPIAEIMRGLKEREKKRRWISDEVSPSNGRMSGGGGGSTLLHLMAAPGQPNRNQSAIDTSSSDFEEEQEDGHAEDLFTQIG